MPTINWPIPWMLRPVGIASIVSRLSTWVCTAVVTSTIGDAAETVTDSSMVPTFISALTVSVMSAGSSIRSRRNV